MNMQEVAVVIKLLTDRWADIDMTEGRADEYRESVKDLAFTPTAYVLRGPEFAERNFAPNPGQVRAAVLRIGRAPTPEPQELIAELHGLVDRFGSYGVPDYEPTRGDGGTPGPSIGFGRVPSFSHQAIGAFVDQNGGWEKVCEAVNQQGKDPTQAAQMREHMKVCIAREREREQRAELESATRPELEA